MSKKSFLALLLSFLMIFNSVPLNVFAGEFIPSEPFTPENNPPATEPTAVVLPPGYVSAFDVVRNAIDTNDDENSTPTVTASVIVDIEQPIPTGLTIPYKIHYKVDNSPVYLDVEANQSIPAYTKYKSVNINVVAPDGIILFDINNNILAMPGQKHTYTFNDVTPGTSGFFYAYGRMAANGIIPDGTQYPALGVSMDASVEVTDVNLGGTKTMLFTPDRIPIANTSTTTNSAESNWSMQKNAVGIPVVKTDATLGKIVEFNYAIEFGKLVGPSISKSRGEYDKYGVNTFEGDVVIEDVLPQIAETALNNTNLKPLRASISMLDVDGNVSHTESYDENTSPVPDKFTLTNKYNKISVGKPNFYALTEVPMYTQYNVKVVYDYDDFALQFGDPRINDVNLFEVTNKATASFKIIGEEAVVINDQDTLKYRDVKGRWY